MAFIRKSAIIWRGDTGSPSEQKTVLPVGIFGEDWTVTSVLANAVNPHSLCNLAYLQLTRWQDINNVAPGVGADISKKATIYFRDPDTLKVKHFTFPSPIAVDLEDVGYGKRVKEAIVIEIVGYLSTFFGKTLIPLYGVYTQKI